ncbi:MAG: lipoyl synthase [Alistipes sp.]|nr:lipoyl synthase [Alistipes sp.]
MPKSHGEVELSRKPDWLKIRLHRTAEYAQVRHIVDEHSLHTICSSGRCPNQAECWSRRTATFMIAGGICTRNCRFCATQSGRPLPLDKQEPERVAESVSLMGLRHVVLTSVTRDDLPDGGAGHWAATVEAIRRRNPEATIELLIPDFDARAELIDTVLAAKPDIVGHNIETVERLTPLVRSRARYATSLAVLKHIADSGATAKSGMMVGLGEDDEEVLRTLHDLRQAGVRIVTIGQYLRPSPEHYPVAAYISPEKFERYRREALDAGFDHCASGPLVRSSYMADEAARSIARR